MRKNGFIDAAAERAAKDEPVRVEVAPPEFLDTAPYYAEAVRRMLVERTSAEEVARGGLTVYAALDGTLQKAANDAIDAGLRELDKRQGWRGPLLRLDPDECRVTRDGLPVSLSPKEYRLLELFMRHPRRVWSRDKLLEQVWGVDYFGDSKTVDVHIRWLREKLEANPSAPEHLITVRGFGYRFG
jgi:DNA-binding response OmpR family regulator